MKKQWILAFSLLLGVAALVTSQVIIIQRPVSSTGLSAGVGYGTTTPTIANSGNPPTDGEIFITRAAGTSDPVVQVYSQLTGGWLTALLSGSTVSKTFDGDIVLGTNDVDDITVNGPVTYRVFREDFDYVGAKYLEFDFTASVLTDAGHNIILMPTSQLGVIGWITESSDGLSGQPEVFGAQSLDTTTLADDIDNDALELCFGCFSPVNTIGLQSSVWFDEDTSSSTYCEISLTLADITETDEVWFGWRLQEDQANPPTSTATNTMAYFIVQDNAGDLDIETELNGGGTLNDDTGIAWADTETKVLRVTALADSVSFAVDGTAVTQTNAVLNFDATDRAVCVFGFTNVTGDATPELGAVINYVEIGVSQ